MLKSLCTLYIKNWKEESNFIWKGMHETISKRWKNSCKPIPHSAIFLRAERPLWYVIGYEVFENKWIKASKAFETESMLEIFWDYFSE